MNKVPYRKVQLFQSDDGRRIQKYSKVGQCKFYTKVQNTNVLKQQNFPESATIMQQSLFIGIVQIGTPVGPKQAKFEIKDATTLQQAFEMYFQNAQKAVNQIREHIKKNQEIKK